MRPISRLALALTLAAVVTLDAGQAAGYEFEVLARSIGQGYQLRSFRLSGSDLRLDRRRFTQTLSLNIWDLAARRGDRRSHEPGLASGPRVYLTTYLRLDHDFGAWSQGQLAQGNTLFDAVDLIPELENGLIALDVLYAYAAAEGLAGGRLDLYAGRLLEVDSLDWVGFDGVKARVTTPAHAAVVGFFGLRTREASPAASPTFAPDGTGGAECAEYVEGQNPGSGSWRSIDRQSPADNARFENDFDRCPQRDQAMPTFGGAVEVSGLDWLWARLGYRRSMSPTPDRIGPVDRFEFPDVGFYPDEQGQAPAWGVNEELVAASLRANRRLGAGRGQITPHVAVRYNLLLGEIDEAHAGVRVRWRGHAVEPELYYAMPSFDGDSIFNVFSSQAYVDARVTYDLALRPLPVAAYARSWVRRFEVEDDASAAGSAPAGRDNLAAGVQIGARWRRRGGSAARVDLFHEGGYGGRRTGGYGGLEWQITQSTGVRARLSVIDFDAELPAALHAGSRATTLGAQVGASYRVNTGVTLHLIAEDNVNRLGPQQFRLLGMMDLAFVPEV